MGESNSDVKRLAKNTILLYIRMFVMMLIGLFTSRFILQALGVENLGIYNVVGGVVTSFTILNAAMSSASTRYISVALANNIKREKIEVFSTTLILHFIVALIILLSLETVGLWTVNHFLVIPEEKLYAANWVFQFSIISCILGVISVPYSSALVSHERMGVYAYMTIVDVILKLLLTIVVCFYAGDRLIMYAFLLLISFVLYFVVNVWYCYIHFEECKTYIFKLEKKRALDMSKYVGWSMYSNAAHVSYMQGLDILLNLFFGPAVNASRGIAGTIQSKVMGFIDNFQMAINPQIIKTYAEGSSVQVMNLVCKSSRITFYLLSLMVIPLVLTIDEILLLWLGQIPEYSNTFCQLILLMNFVNAMSNPFMKVIQADGHLKRNSLYTGTALFLILPLSYICLKIGFYPPTVYIVNLVIYLLTYFIRLKIVYDFMPFDITYYSKKCIVRPFATVLIPLCLALVINNYISRDILVILSFDLLVVVLLIVFICIFGLEDGERAFLKYKFKKVFKIR